MKVKFQNTPDPLQIMKVLADLLEDESGGEYIYEVCQDGKPIESEGGESVDREEKTENVETEIAK